MFPVNNITTYNIIIEPTMTNISRSMVVIKKKQKLRNSEKKREKHALINKIHVF